MGVSNSFFENNFRLEKIETKNDEQKENSNTTLGENDKGKLVLERTPETSTSTESQTPVISLSDETVLKMILKIQFIILDFINNAMDDSDE